MVCIASILCVHFTPFDARFATLPYPEKQTNQNTICDTIRLPESSSNNDDTQTQGIRHEPDKRIKMTGLGLNE